MTKTKSEVWVRWFYISNWGSLQAVKRSKVLDHIEQTRSWYSADFRRKASFEVIDGNKVTVVGPEVDRG